MLIRFKKNFEKIAMGLLSFMQEGKDIKKLQETIKEYETNPDWHLYLWKEDDVLGAIGLKIEAGGKAIIQHISVNPSHRNAGIGKKMVNEIHQMYQEKYTVCANERTNQFYQKCETNDEI
ncbi:MULTISPECIES: GNAT family N-acetyltransferase [unclassified Virgibacillus]|uniref:GNAT family N-acetyltransferase n=1 Tax=unclassified Virgibacillus TaxID=2620237 RepID=UPI0024DE2856|nr:GNAT family N-acetyltransferase [Virgibacillus sp. LDC-1]